MNQYAYENICWTISHFNYHELVSFEITLESELCPVENLGAWNGRVLPLVPTHLSKLDWICFGWVLICELPQPQWHRQGRRQRGRRQRWSSTRAPSTWLRSPSPPRPGAAWIRLSIRWGGGCYSAPARRGTQRGRSSSSRWLGRASRRTLWCRSPENQSRMPMHVKAEITLGISALIPLIMVLTASKVTSVMPILGTCTER